MIARLQVGQGKRAAASTRFTRSGIWAALLTGLLPLGLVTQEL